MKNSEDFRRAVFEKAKRYEERRKARRKKMIETASLCSLCVVIGLSAYLIGSGAGFDHNDLTTTASSPSGTVTHGSVDGTTVESPIPGLESSGTTIFTTTFETTVTTTTPVFTTTTALTMTETTTMETFTSTTTAHTSTTSASLTETEQSESTPLTPAPLNGIPYLDGVKISPETIFSCENDPLPAADIYVIRDESILEQAVFHDVYDKRLQEDDKLSLCERYKEDFFENHVLILAYVPAKWTAYQVSYRHGTASAFFNIEMNKGYDYELHTYILPKNEENLGKDFLLTYEETP